MLQGVPRVQAPVHASSRVSPLEGTLRTNANHGLPTPDKHEGNEGAGSVEGEIELSKPSSAGGEEAACSGGNDIGFTPPENPAPAGAIDPPESVNSLAEDEGASTVQSDSDSSQDSLGSPSSGSKLQRIITPDGKVITGRCLTYEDRRGGPLVKYFYSDKLHYSEANRDYHNKKNKHKYYRKCTIQ